MDKENNNSQWTYEYALSFVAGPFCGAFLAGVCFNMLHHSAEEINNYVPKSKRVDEQNMSTSNHAISQAASYFGARTPSAPTPRPTPRERRRGVEGLLW